MGEETIYPNHTANNGTALFSTSGVTSSTPRGYDTVFYKFAIHEMLHAVGLADTNLATPANIMNGFDSTNDTNNSLGDSSQGISSLITPCVVSQIKAAIAAIHKPAPTDASGDSEPLPDLPFGSGSHNAYGYAYSCYTSTYEEWDGFTSLTAYIDTECI